MYRSILLLIHILGAIAGFGPTFAFGILGMESGKGGPDAIKAVGRAITKIEKFYLLPVAIVLQPLTGVLLIFATGRNVGFFGREWLWVAVLLYAIMLIIALGITTPASFKMHRMAEAGQAGTPEFMKYVKQTKTFGPILGVLLIVIIVLMVFKFGE